MTIEFVSKAKLPVEELGYPEIIKDDMLRDALVYRVGSEAWFVNNKS